MKLHPDTWYVRFPDGRVVRAPNTQVVRQHLSTGQIPLESRVRRSGEDEWSTLDWTREFADLVPDAHPSRIPPSLLVKRELPAFNPSAAQPVSIASRLDSQRLKTVGLQGLMEELVAALDTTISKPKLMVAGTAGVLSAAIVAFTASLTGFSFQPWSWGIWAGVVLGLVAVFAASNVLLTQMTYIELSRLRPARWPEARLRWGIFSFRLFVTFLTIAAGTSLAIWALRQLPDLLVTWESIQNWEEIRQFGLPILTVLVLLLEMVLWPVLGFSLLLGPVVVIEEGTLLQVVGQWWGIIRRHWGRLFLYQFVAVLVGLATLVFAFPLLLVAWARMGHWGSFDNAIGFSLCLLAGLAAAPTIAYLAVAHVFIYLNLRFEVENPAKIRTARSKD
jgi:hypothetical protein